MKIIIKIKCFLNTLSTAAMLRGRKWNAN